MEPYRCPRCQAEFSTAEQLDRHGMQHMGSSKERPPRSPEAFRSAEETERPSGRRAPASFTCPRCGAEFSTRVELDRHGRAQHLAE